ncbi:MAG TPA: outer membrane protein assembly factor BamD [Verrucomicrobiae bacterium]|nr:outer membrane protein assembly factor BamD [Verrucomicrobiae bacterium]
MSWYKKIAIVFVGMLAFAFLLPVRCPAPLIWTKGEGWSWVSEGQPTATTPTDQLKIGQEFQARKQYRNAIPAYRRVIARWPLSLSTQDARMGLAECYSAIGYHFKAFQTYQELLKKNPNTPHFDDVLQREFEIANLFLAGERQKAWGVRWFPSLERAEEVFEAVVKNGPYSPVAVQAQFRIGLVYEKERDYLSAVHAYEKLMERYPKDPMAETAQFQIGWAYKKEAARAEYDQNSANQAIAAFSDFLFRYPQSEKVPQAEKYRSELKVEQARGLFHIGEFYEKNHYYKSALIYYNDVIEQNPESDWATQAKVKVAELTPRTGEKTATP